MMIEFSFCIASKFIDISAYMYRIQEITMYTFSLLATKNHDCLGVTNHAVLFFTGAIGIPCTHTVLAHTKLHTKFDQRLHTSFVIDPTTASNHA